MPKYDGLSKCAWLDNFLFFLSRRYEVSDAAGNQAQRKTRRVSVVCPETEKVCADTGEGPSCSCGGICGVDAKACAGSVSSGGAASSAAGSSQASDTSAAASGASAASASDAERTSVSISLIGMDAVRLKAGAKPYDRCPGAPSEDCDPGATATRVTPGDMTHSIIACRQRAESVLGVARPQPFAVVGLRYCGVDASKAAVYTVVFSAAFLGGLETSAQRTVVVEADCPAGEVRGGVCMGNVMRS